MQRIFLLALDGGEPIDEKTRGIRGWPWSWVRVAFYLKVIKAVREKVQVLMPGQDEKIIENAMPLQWMFFDEEALEEHFNEMRGLNG